MVLAVAERRDDNSPAALDCSEGTFDNSPAFQCRVQSAKHHKSRRDDRVFKMKSRAMVEPMRHPFSRPGGTHAGAGEYPALKRRAIIGLSRWDRARADGRAFRMPQGQRGAPKSDEGGRVALALRTMLGDDGNQIGAHSALPIPHLNGSFPVFILGWTIGAIGVECDGMTSLSSIRHVASNQSADVSAHSKAASGHITCRNKTGFGK